MLHITKTLNKDILLEQIKEANPDIIDLIDSGEFLLGLPKESSVNEYNTSIALHNGEDVNNFVTFYYDRVDLKSIVGNLPALPLIEVSGTNLDPDSRKAFVINRFNQLLEAKLIVDTSNKFNDCTLPVPNLTDGYSSSIALTALPTSLIFIPDSTCILDIIATSALTLSTRSDLVPVDILVSATGIIAANSVTGTALFDLNSTTKTDLSALRLHPAMFASDINVVDVRPNLTDKPGDCEATAIAALATGTTYRGSKTIHYNRIPLDRLCFHIDTVKIYNGLNSTHDIIDMLRIEKNIDIPKSEIVDSPILDTDTEVTLVAEDTAIYVTGAGTLTLNRLVLPSTDLSELIYTDTTYTESTRRVREYHFDKQLAQSREELLALRDQIFIDEFRKLNNYIPLKMSDLEVVDSLLALGGAVSEQYYRTFNTTFKATEASVYTGNVTIPMYKVYASLATALAKDAYGGVVYLHHQSRDLIDLCNIFFRTVALAVFIDPSDFIYDDIPNNVGSTTPFRNISYTTTSTFSPHFKETNLFYHHMFSSSIYGYPTSLTATDISEIYDPANNYWENSDSGKTWYLNDAGYLALRKILVALDPVHKLPYWNIQRLFKFDVGVTFEEIVDTVLRTPLDPINAFAKSGWKWTTRLFHGNEISYNEYSKLYSK